MKKILLLLLLFIFPLLMQAQQGFVSTGGDTSDTGGSLSFSAGEAFHQVDTYGDGSLSEGMQEPHEIIIVSISEEAEDMDLLLLAYPNPVRHMLILNAENAQRDDLHYQLLDLSGRMLKKAAIQDAETFISMQAFDPGLYLLKISSTNQTLKTFRILKTH